MEIKLTDYNARELSKFERIITEVQTATGLLGTDGNPMDFVNAIPVGRFFSNTNPLTPEQLKASINQLSGLSTADLHLFIGSGFIFNIADLFGTIRYQQAVIARLMETRTHDKG